MQWRVLRGRSFQTVTGKGYSPAVMKLGKWRWATFAFCALFFAVTVVLPVSQLLIGSFFKFFGFYEWDMLTLEHYQAVAGSSEFWRAFSNTMLLGFCRRYVDHAAWRHRRLRLGPDQMARSPPDRRHGMAAMDDAGYRPGRGFPVGVRAAASCHSDLRDDLALLLAYISLGTPLSVRVMSSAYGQLSYDLEECSRVHGAGWLQTMWRIMIALVWPSFAVGWVLIFFGIMRELSASVLLYSVGSEVLSVVLLKLWANGSAEQVSVIGLIMMAMVIVFRWVQLRVIKRWIGAL
jgi:iron(III) transport system permease protein